MKVEIINVPHYDNVRTHEVGATLDIAGVEAFSPVCMRLVKPDEKDSKAMAAYEADLAAIAKHQAAKAEAQKAKPPVVAVAAGASAPPVDMKEVAAIAADAATKAAAAVGETIGKALAEAVAANAAKPAETKAGAKA